uniref:Uncharacterized protein n=1 Tax=Anguilla anguilla TaxID=7936 RepID=A0A0E9RA71_ANGAN
MLLTRFFFVYRTILCKLETVVLENPRRAAFNWPRHFLMQQKIN